MTTAAQRKLEEARVRWGKAEVLAGEKPEPTTPPHAPAAQHQAESDEQCEPMRLAA